ncbi:MAG TPA: NAD(P)-dependent alcohol dehydrogenase, partial [Lacipirellulaceae bacterium]|nr:NAD(P)-dependent alcohol dehydrogenase [Lacipirellulaceae bacterium]
MRVIELESFGKMVAKERPVPKAGPGQVVVRMHAASLNYRDLLMVKGGYGSVATPPFVPVSDGAGEIVEIGAGVSRVRVGDRVCPNFFQGWIAGEPRADHATGPLGGPLDGCLAQYMLLSEQGVSRIPDHLSWEEAASLPCAALTAWSAVVTQGTTVAGETVLTQGTGGVSLFALLFAKLRGCRVIATSSSDEKLERLRRMGADHVINYRADANWGRSARGLAGPLGVDHVIDVGGAGTIAQSIKAVRMGGQISLIGVVAGAAGDLNFAL